MAEEKNLCGRIPVELHAKVRQEIESRDISTHEFLQMVLEEHFSGKGVESMVARTLALQVSQEFFDRVKRVLVITGDKQKEFLYAAIEKAVIEVEEAYAREHGQEDIREEVLEEEQTEE